MSTKPTLEIGHIIKVHVVEYDKLGVFPKSREVYETTPENMRAEGSGPLGLAESGGGDQHQGLGPSWVSQGLSGIKKNALARR